MIARLLLALLVAGSLAATGWSVAQVAANPLLRAVVERQGADLAAALDRAMAQDATPERVAARLAVLLDEAPRNWIAIAAVEEVAAEREIALPPGLIARRTVLWDSDAGWLARSGRCLSCVWDVSTCSLTNALVCQAPVAITPVGDVAGVTRAGVAWVGGYDIDRIDLTLSLVGLGATAAFVASGGSSVTVKLGAGLIKTARGMRLLSPRLTALLADTARRGVDWAAFGRMDTLADPARVLRADVVAPLAAIAADLGRINGATDMARTLHLLRHIDGANDARRIADAAAAVGPRVVGQLEVLGKARFLRAGLRWADAAWAMLAGLAGLMLSVAGAVGGLAQGLATRGVRRAARR